MCHPSVRSQVDQLLDSMQTVSFEDTEWVDLNSEWPKLPAPLKAVSDKWVRKLSKLRLPPLQCRFTVLGDITTPLEDGVKCKKSVFCPAGTWEERIDRRRQESRFSQSRRHADGSPRSPDCKYGRRERQRVRSRGTLHRIGKRASSSRATSTLLLRFGDVALQQR
jgi:hypothetical protein